MRILLVVVMATKLGQVIFFKWSISSINEDGSLTIKFELDANTQELERLSAVFNMMAYKLQMNQASKNL
jgi:hypothetical protein